MTTWPRMSQLNDFYGDPRGVGGVASPQWQSRYLTRIKPPFAMTYAGSPISGITVNKNCADAMFAALNDLWHMCNKSQKTIDRLGASIYGGCFNYRLMRGSNSKLSTHSWGCAIDIDPANNGLGDYTPNILPSSPIVEAFLDQGAVWGGDWNGNKRVLDERRPDAMHFQFARL